MFALVTRLSSAVKQLAERHARYKGTVRQLEARLVDMQRQLDNARSKMEAAGLLLTRLEERARLDQIQAISEHPGAYGKRGSLKAAMLDFLRSSDAKWVPTTELSKAMQTRFSLVFESWAREKAWVRNLKLTLERLVAQGVLEQSRTGPDRNDRVLWRLKQDEKRFSLADLRALLGPDEDLAGA